MMISTPCWVACELSFTAKKAVQGIFEAETDAVFTCRESGRKLTVPGFWNGGTQWLVRFALPEEGTWDFTLLCRGLDLGFDNVSGTVSAVPYEGAADIYRHGFIKTVPGKKYFVYDDGTPFFYLGDTHWNMVTEEIDSAGDRAGDLKTDSHFKCIVDHRAAQGFTVYQSEPLGRTFDPTDGTVNEKDIEGLKYFDRYFAYIAEKGLVHANAEWFFPMDVTPEFAGAMPQLIRYWVARYGAYPVLWTLGQEVDFVRFPVPDKDYVTGVYQKMCELLNEFDPYHHPISAHQVNATIVGCKGGVPVAGVDGGYNSYFPADNARTGEHKTVPSRFASVKGHTWWAVQWRPCVDQQHNFGIPRDYWDNGQDKPIINYEARYDHLYTKGTGARVQAWISYLSGMGHAYGGADMWVYRGHYAQDADGFDGLETITVEEKKNAVWGKMLVAPISAQLTFLKEFFTSLPWWKLVPDFGDGRVFKPQGTGGYAAAADGDGTRVIYLYNFDVSAPGTVPGLDENAAYTAAWFDPLTGKTAVIDPCIRACGEWAVPDKPEAHDYVLLITKNR